MQQILHNTINSFMLKNIFNIKANNKKINLIIPEDKYGNKYSAFNPSIVTTKNGYIVNCRISNYYFTSDGYKLINDDTHIISNNILLQLDKNFRLEKQLPILGYSPIHQKYNSGLEDCRLILYNNILYFTATCFEYNISNISRIVLCKLQNNEIENIKLIPEVNSGRPEKNWMPIVLNNKLVFIYSIDPIIIIDENAKILHCKKFNKFPHARGGAATFYNDGILVICHEVDDNCNYFHRLVYYDKNLEIKKATNLFYFFNIGIEFASGICISHDQKIIITSGINDSKPYIFEISPKYLETILYDC